MARKRIVLTKNNVLMREDALSCSAQATGSPCVWVGLSKVNGCVVCVEIDLPPNHEGWPGITWAKFVPANRAIDGQ